MKYILPILCFVLCFCSSEKEDAKQDVIPVCSRDDLPPDITELCLLQSSNPVEPNGPPTDVQFEPCPSPSLKGSVNPDPLIRECPPEDIAECPIQDDDRWWTPILSVEVLSFGKQEEIKCLTLSHFLSLDVADMKKNGCLEERILVSDSINDPPHFIGVTNFRSLICPWFTATRVSERVVHISVDKNETGKEREMRIFVSGGNSGNRFTITQSAE